jgi:hypothetical protein
MIDPAVGLVVLEVWAKDGDDDARSIVTIGCRNPVTPGTGRLRVDHAAISVAMSPASSELVTWLRRSARAAADLCNTCRADR